MHISAAEFEWNLLEFDLTIIEMNLIDLNWIFLTEWNVLWQMLCIAVIQYNREDLTWILILPFTVNSATDKPGLVCAQR